jgi:hypothetical protein
LINRFWAMISFSLILMLVFKPTPTTIPIKLQLGVDSSELVS